MYWWHIFLSANLSNMILTNLMSGHKIRSYVVDIDSFALCLLITREIVIKT